MRSWQDAPSGQSIHVCIALHFRRYKRMKRVQLCGDASRCIVFKNFQLQPARSQQRAMLSQPSSFAIVAKFDVHSLSRPGLG